MRRRALVQAPAGDDGVLPVPPDAVVPIGRRVLAFVVDALVVGVPFAVLSVVLVVLPADDPAGAGRRGATMLVPILVVLVIGLGQLVAEGVTGATLGSAVLGIRTVRATDARPPGFGRVLLRQLVVVAGSLAFLIGQWFVVASGVWDRSPASRGWHDKAAGTMVLWAVSLPAVRGGTVGRPGAPAPITPLRAGARQGSGTPSWATAPPAPPAPPGQGAPVPAPPVAAPPAPAASPAARADVPVLPAAVPAPPDEPVLVWPPALVPPTEGERTALSARTAATPLPDLADLVPLPPRAPATSSVPATPAAADEPLITGLPAGLGTVQPSSRTIAAPRVDLGELELTVLRDRPSGVAAHQPLRLAFDTGQVVDVTGDGLVGRHPEAQPGIVHVVAVDDPARSVSKVHVAFGLDEDGWLWVVDRGSTNGTVLRAPSGLEASLPAGVRAVVGPGWTVRFGERSVVVEPS